MVVVCKCVSRSATYGFDEKSLKRIDIGDSHSSYFNSISSFGSLLNDNFNIIGMVESKINCPVEVHLTVQKDTLVPVAVVKTMSDYFNKYSIREDASIYIPIEIPDEEE